jgi:cation diffusion facilitator family transporter
MIRGERLALGSVGIGCLVLALKALAWWLTQSAAIYSDAVESVVNVASSVITLGAVYIAIKPADDNHPFGHAKAEFFAAVVIGVLIVLAALEIFREAWVAFNNPVPLGAPVLGLGLNAFATVLNFGWAQLLLSLGRREHSPALVADGKHLMADVVTSLGVVVGLGLTALSGFSVVDPILAGLVGLHVLWSGATMISGSVDGLMDAAPSVEIIDRIRKLVSTHAAGALEAHDLRTRRSGRLTFLEFHLVVPGSMTVAEAHDICDRIEAALKAEMSELRTTIHVEPEGKAKHHGVLVL